MMNTKMVKPHVKIFLFFAFFILESCHRKIPTKPTESISESQLRSNDWVMVHGPSLSFAGPHKNLYQSTYANKTAAMALENKEVSSWPYGSEFIKVSRKSDGAIVDYAGQFKNEEWVWTLYDPEGSRLSKFEGSTNSCAQCHGNFAKKFDGVFTPALLGFGNLNIPIKSNEAQ